MAHPSAVPLCWCDSSASAGLNRRISRVMVELPWNPAQWRAVAPNSPGVSTGQPASSISRTASVLLVCAAIGSFRWSASVSVFAASGYRERNS